MELIRGLHNIQPRHRGCVLTIGNFDGVHLGHQAVLARVVAIARQMQLPSCVMLFEPQPLELFAADGSQLAQLYGQRTEGKPEQNQWREQISRLVNKDIAA